MIKEIIEQIKDVRAVDIKSMEYLIDIQYLDASTRLKARSNARVLSAFKALHATIVREGAYHNKIKVITHYFNPKITKTI